MRELRDLDLNLLKLLQAVVETRNTHLAADKLGISQTSVSRGMAKLRETFGDQLFIRKAHGVEPSELATRLAIAADEMFIPVVKVMESYQNFEPENFRGNVNISMNIFILDLFGEGIFTALRDVLPNANFKMTYWQDQSVGDMLNGQIDYMLHFAAFPLPQEIYQHKLKQVKLCLIAKKNHPVLKKSSDWQAIHELPITRILIDGINAKRSAMEELYIAKGYQANLVLETHSVTVLLNKLKNSNAISYGSSFMTQNDPALSCYPLPDMPKDARQIQLNGGYLQSKRGFPLNQLLHQIIQQYFDGLGQPEPQINQ